MFPSSPWTKMMVLDDLRRRLSNSMQKIHNTSIIDVYNLKTCVKEITQALIDAGFPTLHVNEMDKKLQQTIYLLDTSYKRTLIYEIIYDHVYRMLDSGGQSALIQEKRVPSVVLFIGLKGVDKATTCAKYARYHKKKGFRPALVCADTFSFDAFVRLKKASKDVIPVYGSYTRDPAGVAIEGIDKFMKEKRDFIIIDTSDRHKRYSTLFTEVLLLHELLRPDLVVLVIDSSIGQAASKQAQAFKKSFNAGVVILTNIKGYSKAGGALSAVAAAKCPMILAGNNSNEFEAFEVEPFVKGLLGNPWVAVLEDEEQENVEYTYTLRDMYNFYKKELGLDPKFRNYPLPHVAPYLMEITTYWRIMKSMTDEELDKSNVKQLSNERMIEIAKGSKVDAIEVVKMIKVYKKKAKGLLKEPYTPFRPPRRQQKGFSTK